MNISQPVPSTVKSVSFSTLTSDDIRRISVKQIVNPNLLDDLNRPNIGGLYDPALGPSNKSDVCATCRLSYFVCPGHFGHIELPSPVYHPLFMVNMYKLLRSTCLFCHKFKLSRPQLIKYVAKLRVLEYGLLLAADELDELNIKVANPNEEDDEEGEDKRMDESLADFQKRVDLYVWLKKGFSANSTRDSYKHGPAYQARKAVIANFLADSTLKKCKNCNAFSHSLRKEGHTKIVELDLSTKMKMQHKLLNLKRSDVLKSTRDAKTETSRAKEAMDVDSNDGESSSEESEGPGEATFSPDEDEEDSDQQDSTENFEGLPKSASGRVKTMRGRNERVMAPEECRAHLRQLFANEEAMCSYLFGRHGPFAPLIPNGLCVVSADMFFLDCLLVSPTRFRPPAQMGDTLFEHPQNELLSNVLRTSYRLRDLNDDLRKASEKDSNTDPAALIRKTSALLDALIQLQVDVNSFMDSSKNPVRPRQGQQPPPGVKQGLEKKEGLFRMHMMGKRVNYSARSVISPDVNIEPNEIGIPPVFAKKLTFPEPVTDYNVHEMRQLVERGPNSYPGASMIEFEDGKKLVLSNLTLEQRKALAAQLLAPQQSAQVSTALSTRTPAVNKKVYRHLRDGDILILNRQPTLHKPSMMAHKAKVLTGEKTIRMHYANCNSYNADFDGDEMNIHFPQNEVARAEAMFIANTDNQYLVPTSGKPLRGLIQDHVVAGVWMTSKETFFTREEYFQLLYGSLRPEDQNGQPVAERLKTLPPTIWKPKALWTGKQIVSTVLLNITPKDAKGVHLISKAKVSGELWGKGSEEGRVIVWDGELLCGVLDKSQFGASDYGLVHSIYELYGAEVAGKVLGILSRLFTKFLQHRAFTCRMDDLTLTPDGDGKRRDILKKGKNLGTEASIENFPSLAETDGEERDRALRGFLQEVLRDDSKMAGLDMTVKKKLAALTKSIADACMPHGLSRKFPQNHMQMMTQSGAKGSAVNAQQISCALGQQELEGRRVPVMVSGKTLPSFKAFETAAMAGGYVASRFLTGVKPQEFYFHCMAGREGLIDTAVKTSRSGYLQRCLIKHLEGIRIHYDNTVRGSDSAVYQFNYGGDSLDVTKQKYLYQFEFSARNEASIASRLKPKVISEVLPDWSAFDYTKKSLKKLKNKSEDDLSPPVMALYSPTRFLGATSEKFAQRLDEYIKLNPDQLLKSKENHPSPWRQSRNKLIPSKKFHIMMAARYMKCVVEPGEAVGLLASQGVGEPSTQMTLNTFHFAGHGAANVTLGIPRLREIVMTASTKPKTPSMKLNVRSGIQEDRVQKFCKRASRLALSQIVDKVAVHETLTSSQLRNFLVTLEFYPKEEYQQEYDVTSAEVLASFKYSFPAWLKKEIQLELKRFQADLTSSLTDLGKGKTVSRRGEVDDDTVDAQAAEGDGASEVGDGDADDEKRARQSKQMTTYDSDEDDDSGPLGEYDDAALEAEYDDDSDDGEALNDNERKQKKGQNLASEVVGVRKSFVDICKHAATFSFNENQASFELVFKSETPKLLLVGIVERVCLKTVVREIPGIVDCFISRDESKENNIKLATNGSNYRGLWEFSFTPKEQVIDVDKMYSNDIYSGLVTYGVEMARAVILKEVQGVFGAYNIDVDVRHLELIADYMTYDGGFKPFNRKGISTHSSPFLKASYETTAAFISDATLYGDFDDLNTPSGNIVVGKPNQTGTGVFGILQKLSPLR